MPGGMEPGEEQSPVTPEELAEPVDGGRGGGDDDDDVEDVDDVHTSEVEPRLIVLCFPLAVIRTAPCPSAPPVPGCGAPDQR